MKNVKILFLVFSILFSVTVSAQERSEFEYFKGKWEVIASGPTGEIPMVVTFKKTEDEINATMNDDEGKEMFKVVRTSISVDKASVDFIGSQGEVTMVLRKKDENNITGDIMNGMASVSGKRIPERK